MMPCDPLCIEKNSEGYCKHTACIKPHRAAKTQDNAIIFFPYTVGSVIFNSREELEGWIICRQAEMEVHRFENDKSSSDKPVHECT